MAEEKKEENPVFLPDIIAKAFYSNVAVVGISLTEVAIYFSLGTAHGSTVYMPFEVAKSLGQTLLKSVADFENKSGRVVSSMEELISKQKAALTNFNKDESK